MMRWKIWGLDELPPSEANPTGYNPDNEPAPLGDVYRRGEAAHRLLNDPTLAEAFKEIREDLYAEWLASEPAQSKLREELHTQARILHLVTTKLITYRAAARIRRDTAA